MKTGSREVRRCRVGRNETICTTEFDIVAVERPVALVFNGISHAVMLATPLDLEDFALGFALSEGLLDRAEDCYGIEAHPTADGVEVHLDIASRAFARLKEQRRTLAGATGCGLCGMEQLGMLDLHPQRVTARPALQAIAAPTMLKAAAALPSHQPLNTSNGAMHAAAWVSPQGEIQGVGEDVGRHNALDKLIGRRLRARQAGGQPAGLGDGFVLMSSRASYELLRKCARLD
ncbi:MAG TPA: formate dehydrogenase accessory sulfurtransferase FdhD, partial [Methylibium sp.]